MIAVIKEGGKDLILDEQKMDGLMDFTIKHEVKESKAYLDYKGPKIPPEEWRQILSFFKWTYDKYKSESQVRLFINVKEQKWKAWAFPQEADTGMSAREINGDELLKQRAEHFPGDDWMPFGTVHHHCSCAAFQSGTDSHGTGRRDGERNQDGLHITIGKMDEKKHDMHARFYRKEREFSPDMSWFWDVSHAINEIPKRARRHIPEKYADEVAREEMCEPSTVEFPQQWKDNVIEIPKKKFEPITGFTPAWHGGGTAHTYSGGYEPLWQRAKNAWEEILEECIKNLINGEELQDALDEMLNDTTPYCILDAALRRHKLDPSDLYKELHIKLEEELSDEVILAAENNAASPEAMQPDKKDTKKPDLDTLSEQEWSAYCQ